MNFRLSLMFQSEIQVNLFVLHFEVLLSYVACLMEFMITGLEVGNALQCYLCI